MADLLDLLSAWMPVQRWYGSKGREPRLTLVADWELDAPGTRLLLVQDDTVTPPVLYQVPVAERDPDEVPVSAAIGPASEGRVWMDATVDEAFTSLLYRWITVGGAAEHGDTALAGTTLGQVEGTAPSATARVLSGEQSNTSIIFRPEAGGTPVICKVFRQVNPGVNPDVELQSALAAAGARYVPRSLGEVRGTWRSPAGDVVTGSLAFAQEFFEGVEDAWRVALRAAEDGEDFVARARLLGEAVGRMHLALAENFPTREPDVDDRAAVAGAWDRRLAIALAEVPALAGHAERIREVYAAGARAAWPPLQRVHGDLHLGQVIDTRDNGWVLLDFEGEPLRPITERLLPDVAVRDVAGMLRSFDYVSGAVEGADEQVVRAWVIAAQRAFLDGYANAIGPDRATAPELLAAFELDKAVYEAIYESRNRPDWIGIPLAAIGRLAPLDA